MIRCCSADGCDATTSFLFCRMHYFMLPTHLRVTAWKQKDAAVEFLRKLTKIEIIYSCVLP